MAASRARPAKTLDSAWLRPRPMSTTFSMARTDYGSKASPPLPDIGEVIAQPAKAGFDGHSSYLSGVGRTAYDFGWSAMMRSILSGWHCSSMRNCRTPPSHVRMSARNSFRLSTPRSVNVVMPSSLPSQRRSRSCRRASGGPSGGHLSAATSGGPVPRQQFRQS